MCEVVCVCEAGKDLKRWWRGLWCEGEEVVFGYVGMVVILLRVRVLGAPEIYQGGRV